MYLCLPARLGALVVLRVFVELTGPAVSAEVEDPTLLGVSPRVGLLEVGGVLLLTKSGPKIDVLVGLRSLLWYILGALNNPLGNPEVEDCCSEFGTAAGPDWADEGPAGGTGWPKISALSCTPTLRPASSKMGHSKSTIPMSQEGMSGAGIIVVVAAVEAGPETWASSLNLLTTSILVLLASSSCSSLLLRPGSLCTRASV
jgi:hypothetical protein